MRMIKNNLLIFGYGYTAKALASCLEQEKWNICGTSRLKTNDEYCDIIRYEYSEIKQALEQTTHILISIAPTEDGDVVLQEFKELIDRYAINIKWIGYLSSTGVYGNHDGSWVDENAQTNPKGKNGIRRLIAENQWLDFGKNNNIAINIFRLSGIYGPERNALIQVANQTARSIYKEGQVFSRIHVEDIAEIIKLAIANQSFSEIYNLADDHPCSSIEVNEYASELLNVSPPAIIDFKDAQLSIMAQEFYNNNRRVSNKKIKDKLGVILKFPTYKEGLLELSKYL
jgi:nucleoside-diphosphate-sugar epimerase